MSLPNLSCNVYSNLILFLKKPSQQMVSSQTYTELFSLSTSIPVQGYHRADNDRKKDAKSKKGTGRGQRASQSQNSPWNTSFRAPGDTQIPPHWREEPVRFLEMLNFVILNFLYKLAVLGLLQRGWLYTCLLTRSNNQHPTLHQIPKHLLGDPWDQKSPACQLCRTDVWGPGNSPCTQLLVIRGEQKTPIIPMELKVQ